MGWFNSILNIQIPSAHQQFSLGLLTLIVASLLGCQSSESQAGTDTHHFHIISQDLDTNQIKGELSQLLSLSTSNTPNHSKISLKTIKHSNLTLETLDIIISQVTSSSSNYLVLTPQELGVIDSSFLILNSRDLFRSTEDITRALQGPAREYFNNKLHSKQLQILSYLPSSHQLVLSSINTTPIKIDSNFTTHSKPLIQFTRDSTSSLQLLKSFPDFKDYYLKTPSYNDWIIGLDLSLQGKTKHSGEYILAGVEIALNEINQQGLTHGYKLRALPLNNSGFPDRGLDNLKSLLQYPKVLAVFAGMHSQTALLQLPLIEDAQVPFLIPWAAATPLIQANKPNSYAFRLSIRDQLAGKFLVSKLPPDSRSKVALVLENSLWGKSNFKSMTKALKEYGQVPAFVEYFNWGEQSFKDIIERLNNSDIRDVLFVGNAPEGEVFFKDLSHAKNKVNIYSHWGITGGDFFNRIRAHRDNFNLKFIQTFTESPGQDTAQQQFFNMLRSQLKISKSSPLIAPTGAIHAYELTQILNQSIQQSKQLTKKQLRNQLKRVESHQGLFKHYTHPFGSLNEALDIKDYTLCQFDQQGNIVETNDK